MPALSRRGAITAAMGVTAAAVAPPAPPGFGAPPPLAPSTDADLIATCRQHIVNADNYNRDGLQIEASLDPLWHAYERTRDAISAAQPLTMAGVLAKARAAKAEAMLGPGEESWECGPAGEWAGQIVNDLLRLNAA